ncbi:hypothetical protein RB195_016114 [Necator americanus]|uniref:TIL domain-containing protein n=1 Tax=Necator americanus TaxID=51031 RepID=A0ABR1EAA0_NECAM
MENGLVNRFPAQHIETRHVCERRQCTKQCPYGQMCKLTVDQQHPQLPMSLNHLLQVRKLQELTPGLMGKRCVVTSSGPKCLPSPTCEELKCPVGQVCKQDNENYVNTNGGSSNFLPPGEEERIQIECREMNCGNGRVCQDFMRKATCVIDEITAVQSNALVAAPTSSGTPPQDAIRKPVKPEAPSSSPKPTTKSYVDEPITPAPGGKSHQNSYVDEPIIQCGENEKMNQCGKHCENHCTNAGKEKELPCIEVCAPPACVCNDGYLRLNRGGPCVPTNACPMYVDRRAQKMPMYFRKFRRKNVPKNALHRPARAKVVTIARIAIVYRNEAVVVNITVSRYGTVLKRNEQLRSAACSRLSCSPSQKCIYQETSCTQGSCTPVAVCVARTNNPGNSYSSSYTGKLSSYATGGATVPISNSPALKYQPNYEGRRNAASETMYGAKSDEY